MPRSRNSRSASPQKSVSADSLTELERRKVFQSVREIFCGAVDDDVIQLVLQEYGFKEEVCVDKLLSFAGNREEEKKYKSRLQSIAEGVFGSIRTQDYSGNTVPTTSHLSPSEKVIRRPVRSSGSNDANVSVPSALLRKSSPDPQLQARGTGPSVNIPGVVPVQGTTPDEIEMDLHFPQLPLKPSQNLSSDKSSSISSNRSHSDSTSLPSSKTVLLSQAQSAFNQQYDDAEGTQRWEQYKKKLSEHYLEKVKKTDFDPVIKKAIVVSESKTVLQSSSSRSDSVERSRSSSGRNFPVRLLSRSPETVLNEDELPNSVSSQAITSATLDSSDLDETVLKCIYEIQGDLLDEKELARKAQKEEKRTASAPAPIRLSSQPMTLPKIGLSVDAEEFVPKAKPVVATTQEVVTTTIVDTIPQPASRSVRSNSVEIKAGVKNVQNNSPSVTVVSPLTISPSLSPSIGLSPPSSIMSSPVANLTGSPMFITPKWPPPPVYHAMNRPQIVAPPTSRFIGPPSLPTGFNYAATAAMPYTNRVLPMYTVAPPPLFRMASVPQYVQQPGLPRTDTMEERVAVATGQPIMATSEASRFVRTTAGMAAQSLLNSASIEQKIEKIQKLQQTGLKVLVIIRGLPGSGKSTLARALQLTGLVLSTDDYFTTANVYEFKQNKLTEAHQWNRERTREAMKMGKSPVIIDNTNTQVWEFKPYINLAQTFSYHIEIFEPDTPWKFSCGELARHTMHGVPLDQIQRMFDRYEHNITLDMVVRKRISESKLIGSSDGLEASGETTVPVKVEKTQDEFSKPGGFFSEARNLKELLRLQNTARNDELRKQKSAESDSDSISSFQSGSLSNQSSRNASPKPLRPSLKPPGALQKMDKQKSALAPKPAVFKTSVLKSKRKAMKQVEAKLSANSLNIVEELILEHARDKILSAADIKQVEEELKALVQLVIEDQSEIPLAEELIGLKLFNLTNQSTEIQENDDDELEDIKETADDNIISPQDQEVSLSNESEQSENTGSLKLQKCSKNTENIEEIYMEEIVEENSKESSLKTEITNNELYIEPDTSSDSNVFESKLSSWQDITRNHNHVNLGDSCENEDIHSTFYIGDTPVEADTNHFELQYWGIRPKEEAENDVYIEEGPDIWDFRESWDQSGKGINETAVKPQRKKRIKSSEFVVEEADHSECNNGEIGNDTKGLGQAESDAEFSEPSNEADEEVSSILASNSSSLSDFSGLGKSKEGTAADVERNNSDENEEDNFACKKGNSDSRDGNICSDFKDALEYTSQRSQDIVPSTINHSLQMLKDSYIDSETVCNNNEITESGIDAENVHRDEELEDIKTDLDTVVELEVSVEKLHVTLEDASKDENTTNFTADGLMDDDFANSSMITVRSEETLRQLGVSEIGDSAKSDSEVVTSFSPQSSPSQKTSNNSKSGKRKMAANFRGPFLNQDDKEKFKSNSWSSFPIPSDTVKPVVSPHLSRTSSDSDLRSVETETDIDYFNIVSRLNQGEFFDSRIKYLTGNARKMVNNGFQEEMVIQATPVILTHEKGTSTDDLIGLTDAESISFLLTCFPDKPANELECVLENCGNNIEWAINLLLDWKYDLHLTEEEKTEFAESVKQVQKGSGVETIDNCTDNKGPKSLLDLCFDLVEEKKIAKREDIEMQMIQTGKERLDRIEDDSMCKIRLHRSFSHDEAPGDSKDVPSCTKNSLSRYASSSGKSMRVEYSGQVTIEAEDFSAEGKLDISEKISSRDTNSRLVNDVHAIEHELNDSEAASTSVSNHQESWDDDDLMLKPAMTMTVSSNTIKTLENIFGSIGYKEEVRDDLLVPLDRKMAWLLYQSVKHGIIQQRAQQRREQQQLREDEELARRLQEAEDAAAMSTSTRVPGSLTRKSTPVVGHSLRGTIPYKRESLAPRGGNLSLAEIMKEEQMLQEKELERERQLQQEGEHIATSLKRQKLYGKFPKLDRTYLNDIFKANCYNLHDTMMSVRTSLGEFDPGQASVTMETHDHDQLIEATKQQSLQEMLDSYIYHPVISKDYQDGEEPEYEDLRGEATLHYRLRHECFQKAKEAYRRGLKQVASFYSQQGHQHTQKIKEANMRASEQILADRNVDIEKNQMLDLHGLHVDEAIAALNRIIPQKELDRCKNLTVMTGRGSHSRGGIARLRPAVVAYLNANKYNFTELQPGVFKLSLKYRSPDR